MTLTDEQVRALLAGEFDVWDGGHVDVRDALIPTNVTLAALATEVLAQRARRCGTCRYHDTSHVDMSGRLACLRLGRLVAADWFCADWRAKETT